MEIKHVSLPYCAQTWDLVKSYIDSARQWDNGDYTLDQIKMCVLTGQWLLLVAVEDNIVHGACTISFINQPNDRVAFVTYIGGKLISNKDTFAQLENIVKSFGATKLQGAARESIARLWRRFNFKERHVIVEKKL